MALFKYYDRSISVVVPIYNEADSLDPLVKRIVNIISLFDQAELILINDGSTDGSYEKVKQIALEYPSLIKLVSLRKNCGKSIALMAGFERACGHYIVMMDADLQDHPEEIPGLIEHLESNNLDAVTGWKKNRNDPITKTLPSKLFNKILQYLSGINIHDFNCGLKVFRRESLKSVVIYGQLHRFILILMAHRGYKVGEKAITHSARKYGKTKYGAKRIYHGLLDILTVFFLTRYLESPLYFFGFYGLSAILLSLPIGFYFISAHFLAVIFGWDPQWYLDKHPLWLISPILFLLGLIMIFFGLLGELITFHTISTRPFKELVEEEKGF